MRYIYIFLIISVLSKAYSIDQKYVNKQSISIVNRWLLESIDLTRNCVGFSAPVASRAFAYFTIALYECGIENRKESISLSNQLQNYNRQVWLQVNDKICWQHAYNYTGYKASMYLYANMPPFNMLKVEHLYDSLYTKYKKKYKKKYIFQTENYIDSLLAEIWEWSESDGGHLSYNTNYPNSYVPPSCQSCWTYTVPGYLKPLQPYWKNQRFFISDNNLKIDISEYPVYSLDSNSSFYKDAKEIYQLHTENNPVNEIISEYWDDAPGYSGTPTGHILSIALQLSKRKKLGLEKSLQLYVLLTVSIRDAFICCWKYKYDINLIRPITYIHRNISKDFNTIIPTPPFPEFPSGHSMQSSAAIEIFKFYLGDTINFIDSTNIYRRDINGKPRYYKSFTDMKNEISISRLYGGIHYRSTLYKSLNYGTLVGLNTIKKVKLSK